MDSKTETVSDNAMIAEFMAAKNHINESERKEYLLLDAPKGFSGDCWYEVGNVRYHTSWDWLMPVVEKIESIDGIRFIIEKNRVMVMNSQNEYFWNSGTTSETKITTTYNAVVEFIKHFNSQSPDTIK